MTAQTLDTVVFGDDADYFEAEWRKAIGSAVPDGCVWGYLGGMQPFADSTGMHVKVDHGAAWINGKYGELSAQAIVPLQAAASTPRIDKVVFRNRYGFMPDGSGGGTMELDVLTGVASSSPSPPALTDDSTMREIEVMTILVPASAVTIASANTTDTRAFTNRNTFRDALIETTAVTPIPSSSFTAIDTATVKLPTNWKEMDVELFATFTAQASSLNNFAHAQVRLEMPAGTGLGQVYDLTFENQSGDSTVRYAGPLTIAGYNEGFVADTTARLSGRIVSGLGNDVKITDRSLWARKTRIR